jgi:YebC/PmpR family DNA-binding regulatory protein
LPRGTGALGFYEKPEQRTIIRKASIAADLPEAERHGIEVLRTDTPLFTKYVESRRNRRDTWYIRPPVTSTSATFRSRCATSSRIRAPMGRIFEVRKHTMFARWDRMAKQFARIAKDINIAVKSGGGDVNSNPALRRAVQNARHVNMPKDKVDAAIKRALGNDSASYEQIIYEGYAPHGVAVIVEAATDNATRTVAQVRTILSKGGGNLGTAGSVAFQFRKMGVFRLKPDGIDQDDLELYLIDHGLDEFGEGTGDKGEPQLVARCLFPEFGHMQEALENAASTRSPPAHEYISTTPVELPEAQATEVLQLIDALEQNDDVQNVYHSLV